MLTENIKVLRKQKGMSQETMAQQLNVVRQTVSKWEKGLSVPDAEMLTRIAELFEVPVSTLLGDTVQEEKTANEVAMQLAILNEQLANRSRRNKRIFRWVVIGIVLLPVLYVVTGVLLSSIFGLREPVGRMSEVELACTVEDETYYYTIVYDEQFQVYEAGGDAWIANHVIPERYDDANVLIAQIENFVWSLGGTVTKSEPRPVE